MRPVFSVAVLGLVFTGCHLTPTYTDVVWACDNRRAVEAPSCSGRGDIEMTVGFYEKPDGNLIFRLRDYGNGINCRILEVRERWMKIELTTGRVGYVDFEEPVTTTTPLHSSWRSLSAPHAG